MVETDTVKPMKKSLKKQLVAGLIICMLGAIAVLAFVYSASEAQNARLMFEKDRYISKMETESRDRLMSIASILAPNVDPAFLEQIVDSVVIEADSNGLRPEFVLCYISRASGFNQVAATVHPNVDKRIGLMQIIDDGSPESYHVGQNIKKGCSALAALMLQAEGDPVKALGEDLGKTDKSFTTDLMSLFTSVMYTTQNAKRVPASKPAPTDDK